MARLESRPLRFTGDVDSCWDWGEWWRVLSWAEMMTRSLLDDHFLPRHSCMLYFYLTGGFGIGATCVPYERSRDIFAIGRFWDGMECLLRVFMGHDDIWRTSFLSSH